MKNRLPCSSFVVLLKSSIFSVSALRDGRHQATENKASFWGRTFHGCLIKDFDAENRCEKEMDHQETSHHMLSHLYTLQLNIRFLTLYSNLPVPQLLLLLLSSLRLLNI